MQTFFDSTPYIIAIGSLLLLPTVFFSFLPRWARIVFFLVVLCGLGDGLLGIWLQRHGGRPIHPGPEMMVWNVKAILGGMAVAFLIALFLSGQIATLLRRKGGK